MADSSRWEPIVEALRAKGFDARLRVGFMEMVSIGIELGDGWSASITTGTGSLDDFKSSEPVRVNLDGPGLPGEGYVVTWWPETTQIRRVVAAVAPLLRRVSAVPLDVTDDAAADGLDPGSAEEALRGMLDALGARDVLDPRLIWRTFSTFALRSVGGVGPTADEDLVLFETAGRAVNLTRQFTAGDEMEQLSCTLTVDAELPAATVWGPGGAAAAEWIAEVEASEALRRATSATVATLEIRQSPV